VRSRVAFAVAANVPAASASTMMRQVRTPQRRLCNRLSPSQPGPQARAPRLPQSSGRLYERIDARACAQQRRLNPLRMPANCIERGHCGKIGAKRTVDDPAAISVQFARSSRPNSRILR
jgi:hypothetical protein